MRTGHFGATSCYGAGVFSTLTRILRTLVLASALIASLAHASPRVDELLSQGVELRRQGNDAAALERFREAHKLEPGPRTLAQMGLAEQALGFWMAADRHVRLALETAQDPWIRKHRPALEQALTLIDSHLTQLHITGSPDGAEVLVDGEAVGTLPLTKPLRVSQGTVVVDVRAKGYVPISRPLQIAPGMTGREHFALQPLPAKTAAGVPEPQPLDVTPIASPTPPPEKSTEKTTGRLRVLGWVAAAAGAGALGWGIYEHLALRTRKRDYTNGGCERMTSARCDGLASDGKTAQTLMFVGYGLAAALAATSIIAFVNDRPASGDQVAITCVPTLATPGASCALRF